jgi:hypothetical protein
MNSLMISTRQNILYGQPLKSVRDFVRNGVWAVVTCTVLLAGSKSASATCGNYLFRNGKPVADHAMTHAQTMQETNIVLGQFATRRAPAQTPVRRCSGPNCSNNPVPFAPVPSAPISQMRGFDPAALLESISLSAATLEALELPESERGARYWPSAIFRPPMA